MNEYSVKIEIRNYILSIRDYINLSGIARAVGLSRQSLTFFLMDEYHLNVISLPKLLQVRDFLQNFNKG